MRKIRKSGKLVFGVGINDADYNVCSYLNDKVICPYYHRWSNILRRCYSKKFHESGPTYVGCTICEDWKSFSNFKVWMQQQDWEGKDLDKDLLVSGNKIYSPETCVFIDVYINRFLNLSKDVERNLPVGVTIASRVTYLSRGSERGNRVKLGLFDCPLEAHKAWQLHKIQGLTKLKETVSDVRVVSALDRIIKVIFNDLSNSRLTSKF